MNAIAEIVNAVLSGHPLPLSVLSGTVITFVLYRLLGKQFDELYGWLRKRKSHEAEIVALQRSLIDEIKRADEAEAVANRSITLSHDLHWDLLAAERRIAELEQRFGCDRAS